VSILTIVYAGNQVFNAEVQSFGYEANAKGDLFVTASTQAAEDENKPVEDTLDPELDPDGRYTADELAIIRKRNA
jgi:hypothetical protein